MGMSVPRHGKEIPMLAHTPAEYIAGQQEANVVLTSMADMLRWAQNYARSRSIWPLGYGLACCAIEMMATAQSHYDLARFGSEVFRSSPRQADLMIVAGTVCTKMGPRLVRLYEQMPDPKWVISHGPVRHLRRRVLRQLLHGAGCRHAGPGGCLRARVSAAAGGADRGDSQAAREDREAGPQDSW